MSPFVDHSDAQFGPDGNEPDQDRFFLRLFVTGMTPRSTDAISQTIAVCEEYLAGRYDLEVIDIYQQPKLAQLEQIVATPTLVKKLPLPLCRLVGDLSNKQRLMIALGVSKPSESEI